MEFYCEECKDEVKPNALGNCPECGTPLDIDEDVLVSGCDANDFTEVDDGGDGYGDDYDYDNSVQEYD